MEKKKSGLLGDLLKMPFKIAIQPFKSAKEYYGKPYENEEYKSTFAQKQRLKKTIPLVLSGEIISDSDKKFMNMFNDFLTSEGVKPVDQSNIKMSCDEDKNCVPYIYKSSGKVKKSSVKDEENDDNEEENSEKSIYKAHFKGELKPKDSTKNFKENQIYSLVYLGKAQRKNFLELYFKNAFLKENDYLIFVTKIDNPFDRVINYTVYQNNSKIPLKHPTLLGDVNVKIY